MDTNSEKLVRLQKAIADAGFTSRRKAEDLIVQGKVKVNGQVVTTLGTKVDPKVDVIDVQGQSVDPTVIERVYILLNKPRAFVTTLHDPEGRKTILDLIPQVDERVFPVGRLDYLSEGLIILTNDGELANMVMHPSFEVEKVYEVKIFGMVNEYILSSLRRGVWLPEGFAKPKSVRVLKELPGKTWLEFRLNEGKNREIRRLCEAVGVTIDKLKRVAIEGASVEDLQPGQYKIITKKKLLALLGINERGEKTKARPFYSSKPTRPIRGKFVEISSLATHRGYQAFRKENYYDTIQKIAQKKAEEQAQVPGNSDGNDLDASYPT